MKKLLIMMAVLFAFASIFAAPLTEGFESATCPATGWSLAYGSASPTNPMTHSTTYYYEGARSFRFSSYNSDDDYNQYLISPQVVTTSGDQTVSFWYRRYDYGSELFKVGWSSTDIQLTSFTWSDEISNASTTWQQYTKTDLPVGTKYLAIHYYSDNMYYLYVDTFVGPEKYVAPTPVLSLDPTSWNFGEVDITTGPYSKTFTMTNTGGADLIISAISGATGDFSFANVPALPCTISTGNDETFDVVYNPLAVGYDSINVSITDNVARATTLVPVYGTGVTRPAGSTCGNPYDFTLPVVDYSDNTFDYGEDYDNTMVTASPSNYYLGGYDFVGRFTLAAQSYLSGSVSGSWTGVHIVATEPSVATPAAILAQGSGSTGGSFADVVLDAGTYYAIVDTWPTPYYTDFVLNLSAVAVPEDPVFAYDPTALDFGPGELGVPVGPLYVTITNEGGGELVLNATDISIIGTDAASFSFDSANLPDTLGNFESLQLPVYMNASTLGAKTATLRITSAYRTDYDVALSGGGYTGVAVQGVDTAVTLTNTTDVWAFLDSGGYNANYGNNEWTYLTFTPPTGYRIQCSFNSFYTEAGWDTLFVFAGADTTAPVMATYDGQLTIPAFNSYGGAMTFKFKSDTSVNYAGWFADIDLMEIPTVPIFEYSPTSISFGSAVVGETQGPVDVTVTNTGAGTIVVQAADISIIGTNPGEFSFDPVNLPDSLEEGESVIIPVSFTPTSAGAKTATLRITNAYRTDHDVALDGLGFPTDALVEDFEGATFPPWFWKMDETGTPWEVTTNLTYVIADLKSAIIFQDSTYAAGQLITPRVVLDGSVEVLSFFTSGVNNTFGEGNSILWVTYQEDGDTGWTAIGDTIDYSLSDDVRQVVLDISSLPWGVYRFSFNTISNFWYEEAGTIYSSWVLLDDILGPAIYVPEVAPAVTQILPEADAVNLPKTGFDLTWEVDPDQGIPEYFGVFLSTDPDDPYGQEYWDPIYTDSFNPVEEMSYNLLHGQPYYWTVYAYNAYGEYYSTTRRFDIAPEIMYNQINLTGSVVGNEDIVLNWLPTYADTNGTWIYYDNGNNTYGYGNGGVAHFKVAAKFLSSSLVPYAGQDITVVKFFPRADAEFTIKIWTGSDAVLAPDTEIYSQVVGNETPNTWNEVALYNPVPIDTTVAMYIGYEVSTQTGYPAGCDNGGGGFVDGLSNIYQWGSEPWETIPYTYSWNIRGFVTDSGARTAELTNIPLVSDKRRNNDSDYSRRGVDPNDVPDPNQRLLEGYNVYRDAGAGYALLTPTPISGLTYTDDNPGVGVYDYYVEAVYEGGTVESNVWQGEIALIPPIDLPFTEDWASGSFLTNNWTPGSTNWFVTSGTGNPIPSATFSWTPSVQNYSIPLTSFRFDGSDLPFMKLKFDLYLDNYSTLAENLMSWEVWDGSVWTTLGTVSSLDDDFDWTSYEADITSYAAGHEFQIRFRAHGEDSYEINNWYIDNIQILAELDVPDVTVVYSDVDELIFYWDYIDHADWYGIYYSTDPYTGFTYIGSVDGAYNGFYWTGLIEKEFIKVTAGSGTPPARGGQVLRPAYVNEAATQPNRSERRLPSMNK